MTPPIASISQFTREYPKTEKRVVTIQQLEAKGYSWEDIKNDYRPIVEVVYEKDLKKIKDPEERKKTVEVIALELGRAHFFRSPQRGALPKFSYFVGLPLCWIAEYCSTQVEIRVKGKSMPEPPIVQPKADALALFHSPDAGVSLEPHNDAKEIVIFPPSKVQISTPSGKEKAIKFIGFKEGRAYFRVREEVELREHFDQIKVNEITEGFQAIGKRLETGEEFSYELIGVNPGDIVTLRIEIAKIPTLVTIKIPESISGEE